MLDSILTLMLTERFKSKIFHIEAVVQVLTVLSILEISSNYLAKIIIQ